MLTSRCSCNRLFSARLLCSSFLRSASDFSRRFISADCINKHMQEYRPPYAVRLQMFMNAISGLLLVRCHEDEPEACSGAKAPTPLAQYLPAGAAPTGRTCGWNSALHIECVKLKYVCLSLLVVIRFDTYSETVLTSSPPDAVESTAAAAVASLVVGASPAVRLVATSSLCYAKKAANGKNQSLLTRRHVLRRAA